MLNRLCSAPLDMKHVRVPDALNRVYAGTIVISHDFKVFSPRGLPTFFYLRHPIAALFACNIRNSREHLIYRGTIANFKESKFVDIDHVIE